MECQLTSSWRGFDRKRPRRNYSQIIADTKGYHSISCCIIKYHVISQKRFSPSFAERVFSPLGKGSTYNGVSSEVKSGYFSCRRPGLGSQRTCRVTPNCLSLQFPSGLLWHDTSLHMFCTYTNIHVKQTHQFIMNLVLKVSRVRYNRHVNSCVSKPRPRYNI